MVVAVLKLISPHIWERFPKKIFTKWVGLGNSNPVTMEVLQRRKKPAKLFPIMFKAWSPSGLYWDNSFVSFLRLPSKDFIIAVGTRTFRPSTLYTFRAASTLSRTVFQASLEVDSPYLSKVSNTSRKFLMSPRRPLIMLAKSSTTSSDTPPTRRSTSNSAFSWEDAADNMAALEANVRGLSAERVAPLEYRVFRTLEAISACDQSMVSSSPFFNKPFSFSTAASTAFFAAVASCV